VDLEGRAQPDVARELGLSESGARSRVQRARARLRERLEACCRFAFDARGNLTDATRRPGRICGCDPA
jgi:RNA polymerase sigma-70 factor (ECF subfamily)